MDKATIPDWAWGAFLSTPLANFLNHPPCRCALMVEHSVEGLEARDESGRAGPGIRNHTCGKGILVMQQEGQYARQLVRELRTIPGVVVFKHADSLTAGIPDISVTGNGKTLWLECKVIRTGTDRVPLRPLQHQTMIRLSQAGMAYYIVWTPRGVARIHPEWPAMRLGRNHYLSTSIAADIKGLLELP